MKINIRSGGAIDRPVTRDASDGSGAKPRKWHSNADICGQRPRDRQLRPEVPACMQHCGYAIFQLNPNLAVKNLI